MIYEFIIGTAGSGKSTLCGLLNNYFEANPEIDSITVNLDPGTKNLPYAPDVDIRDYIITEDIMMKYNLGINGSIIASVDMIINYINDIKEEIESFKAEHIIIDTPGQMELFAYRKIGSLLISSLAIKKGGIIYLVDSNLAKTPSGYLSTLLLGLSVQCRYQIPQLYVLSKKDILSEDELQEIIKWKEYPETLYYAIENKTIGENRELNIGINNIIENLDITGDLFPFSSIKGESVLELYALISRVFLGGEDFNEEF